MFAGGQDLILDADDLICDAGAFPLPAEPCRAGKIGGPKPEDVDAVDAQQLADVPPAADRFDDRNDEPNDDRSAGEDDE